MRRSKAGRPIAPRVVVEAVQTDDRRLVHVGPLDMVWKADPSAWVHPHFFDLAKIPTTGAIVWIEPPAGVDPSELRQALVAAGAVAVRSLPPPPADAQVVSRSEVVDETIREVVMRVAEDLSVGSQVHRVVAKLDQLLSEVGL